MHTTISQARSVEQRLAFQKELCTGTRVAGRGAAGDLNEKGGPLPKHPAPPPCFGREHGGDGKAVCCGFRSSLSPSWAAWRLCVAFMRCLWPASGGTRGTDGLREAARSLGRSLRVSSGESSLCSPWSSSPVLTSSAALSPGAAEPCAEAALKGPLEPPQRWSITM
jgi:hypothetical protein